MNVFEGVEKRIEVSFAGSDVSPPEGLRCLDRTLLDELCSRCKCEIIYETNLPGFDSYILSESSLFVFPLRIIIKTCGTTVPLNGVDFIVRKASELGLTVMEMVYSRTSFMFPELQQFPHNSLKVELDYLESMEIDGRTVPGRSSILGGPCGKHWVIHRKVFVNIDGSEAPVDTPEHRQMDDGLGQYENKVTVDVIMTGLCPDVCGMFYKNHSETEGANEKKMNKPIRTILPEFDDVQGKCYNPCGYSANGHILGAGHSERIFTVHVTPEQEFSYASFEAVFYPSFSRSRSDEFGLEADAAAIKQIQIFLINVLSVFKPDSAIITMMSSDAAVSATELPTSLRTEKMEYMYNPVVYTSGNLLGEDIVASSVYYSGVSSGNTGTKPTGLS